MDSINEEETTRNERTQIKKMKFRNYVPRSDALREVVEVKKFEPVSLESEIKEQIDIIKEEKSIADEVDLNVLERKKVDLDIKRRIEGKLNKLERLTKKAIDDFRRR